MNKRWKFLFIMGIVVLIIAISAINILIKKYEKETTSLPPEILKKSDLKETAPAKKSQELEPEEEEAEKQPPPVYPKGIFLN